MIKYNWPMLSDFFDDGWTSNKFFSNGDWSPAINVVDNASNYEIEVAAPGLKKEDFSVSCENGVLTISGKTENEETENAKNYTRREFSARAFSKSFTLPNNVADSEIDAQYKDGILRLMLKKTENALPPKREVVIH